MLDYFVAIKNHAEDPKRLSRAFLRLELENHPAVLAITMNDIRAMPLPRRQYWKLLTFV